MQKTICLLELAGEGPGFHFEYHRYGPYCEDVARATHLATDEKIIKEEIKTADWGGEYSVYTVQEPCTESDTTRAHLAHEAANVDAVVLELAATAAFLKKEGVSTPWEETALRKPGKADNGRLEQARDFYQKLRDIAPALPEMS